jgi:hypothetical protein
MSAYLNFLYIKKMKPFKILSLLSILFAASCNSSLSYSSMEMEMEREQDLLRIFQQNLQEFDWDKIANQCKNKHLVIFLGKTNSGKSTLINYLAGKELLCDQEGDIVLENPNDPLAAKIGCGDSSITSLPSILEANPGFFYSNLFLCDLPGFNDSRGIVINLINLGTIATVIKSSKSVRIVFVISHSDIDSGRGRAFKDLMETAKGLMSRDDIRTSSCVVFTKVPSPYDTSERFLDYAKRYAVDNPVFEKLLEEKRFSIMKRAINNIDSSDKQPILNLINSTIQIDPTKVKLSALARGLERADFQNLFTSMFILHGKVAKKNAEADLAKLNSVGCCCQLFCKALNEEDLRNSSNVVTMLQHLIVFENDEIVKFIRERIDKEIYDKEVMGIYKHYFVENSRKWLESLLMKIEDLKIEDLDMQESFMKNALPEGLNTAEYKIKLDLYMKKAEKAFELNEFKNWREFKQHRGLKW